MDTLYQVGYALVQDGDIVMNVKVISPFLLDESSSHAKSILDVAVREPFIMNSSKTSNRNRLVCLGRFISRCVAWHYPRHIDSIRVGFHNRPPPLWRIVSRLIAVIFCAVIILSI